MRVCSLSCGRVSDTHLLEKQDVEPTPTLDKSEPLLVSRVSTTAVGPFVAYDGALAILGPFSFVGVVNPAERGVACGIVWVCTVACLLLLVFLIYVWWKSRLVVYEWGIEWHNWRGDVTLPFDEVEDVYGFPGDDAGIYALKAAGGPKVPLSPRVSRQPLPALKIERLVMLRVVPRLVQEGRESLSRGAALRFGKAVVTLDDLAFGKTKLPWRQISRIHRRQVYANDTSFLLARFPTKWFWRCYSKRNARNPLLSCPKRETRARVSSTFPAPRS